MTAIEQIIKNIDSGKSFVLEAGAGSGKTYTLIQTLNYLIENKGKDLKYNHQKIICITYTNVAKNEIIERLENHPLVLVSTIHEFLWECIKSYEKQLKIELCKLNEIRYKADIDLGKESRYIENLVERLNGIDSVVYNDTAFRDFEKGQLHHDDVIVLSKMMFQSYPLLTNILSQKFPYLLIDEYQDTAPETINALIDSLLENNKAKIVIGFYGDSHQKIYNNGVGDLTKYYINSDDQKLHIVKKEENYRSSKAVVNLLNNFRTNIKQHAQTELQGSVKFIYCEYRPIKTRINRNNREVEDENKTAYNREINLQKNLNFDKIVTILKTKNWVFDHLDNKKNDKILVLVNSAVAKRNGFSGLYRIYSKRYTIRVGDELNKRKNALIQYFVGYTDKKTSQERETGVEHLIKFWKDSNYNEVLRFLKRNSSLFDNVYLEHKHKKIITDILNNLMIIRDTKSVKEVMEFVDSKKLIRKSDTLKKFFDQINSDFNELDEGPEKTKLTNNKTLYDSLMELQYKEIINFFEFTQNHTVFSTKHGTKGEEYRNVLTVIDDKDWVNEVEGYNFEGFFSDTDINTARKLRTRNLFYVECSRAKENLVVLALSPMGEMALHNVRKWFGNSNVMKIDDFK
ncbi:UvrD-helicase domain-containing protein [Chryseobacterium takakiae]|uniref:DNA helicase-2 / ATP-dependent DNA helicase PcrA n=1 Tax=Chryseobacterium takakiae TaxID=1302685 RepID=A0A1M4WB53_9FLAO|nr:ATP-dependent helicase [Chryseobacterium takakiae]SHE78498.1 DNA helicase-2 / ATP-dependent DNA helicase PcrA [Chryseobacterium takakiae]